MFKNKLKLRKLLLLLLVVACICCVCITVVSAATATDAAAVVTEEEDPNTAAITKFLNDTGVARLLGQHWADTLKTLAMILISFILMYLAIGKGFEPLLLLPIAFGMLLTNLPGAGVYHPEMIADGHVQW